MRTLFTWEKRDKPLQVVRERVTLPWRMLDWRDAEPAEQTHRWESLLARDRDQGFDLERAPLMRFALIRLDEHRYRFLWSFHHILMDGWSTRLLMSEALRIYATGTDAGLQPARPFGDFIEWLDRQDAAASQAHWTQLLRGFTAPTALPGAEYRDGSGHAGQREHQLSAAATARLARMAAGARITLNTAVTGAWALLLARYAGSDDVVFGGTVAGRPIDLDCASTIAGLFINTLPLRVRVSDGGACDAWLRELQDQQLAARRFEQTPLVDIQRWSDVRPGRALFETIVVFENFPPPAAAAASGNALQPTDEAYLEYSNFPLALLAVPGERLRLIAVFDPRRYRAAAVDRLLEQLDTILDAMASAPERPPSEVPLLSEGQRRRVLERWNDTRVEFAPHATIHELIEACAARTPGAVAVASDDGAVDYRGLDELANRLAHLLQERGVGRGACVPVFMERSADAIVAILAVLKAGAAYVPVDAAFPAQRLGYLLEDLAADGTGRPLVITQRSLLDRLSGADVDVVCVDRDAAEIDRRPATKPPATSGADDLAYLIYTSGSTGRPKGVMITHANLINSTLARPHHYPEPLSAYLLLSSLATDSSVAGIFWTLCTGATLILPRGRQEQDLDALRELMLKYRASHLLGVPSLYNLLMEVDGGRGLASLRAVIVAGEACPADVVARHEELLPDVALYNEYGPTEATVWATVARLDGAGSVTIGRPIANARIYVLDAGSRPVPVGIAGELCIGGAGIARGYLNLPGTTAEKFLPDPFAGEPDARMYRTGDLARYRDDGRIEFLGRSDNQIKIRGYRVEPEEIEATLTAHPSVAEAAVVLEAGEPDLDALLAALDGLDDATADGLIAGVEEGRP
jgi:amino acid adenylation domain-containing protein